MKLNSFKFQDGKVFWLPEYPEEPGYPCLDCTKMDCDAAKCTEKYDEAVAKSLASAIEVAPEDRERVKSEIWWANIWTLEEDKKHGGKVTLEPIINVWQPENGKVYSAECEMETEKQGICCAPLEGGINHHGYCDECPNYTERQVAHLKPIKQ